jgi:Uma2 family endonuclease
MGMPDLAPWTRAQVLALPDDGQRHELLDGELLVTPAPAVRHQVMVSALFERLVGHVGASGVGRALWSPADLFGAHGHLLQPDLFVLPTREVPTHWRDAPDPILVVEVLSPSTARYDRGLKRRFYQRAGVSEYWIVDPDARVMERWRPDDERPEVLDGALRWQPRADLPPLVIDLPALFAEAAGE